MDYENEGVLAPGSPTASDSTLSWLFQSPTPLNLLTISMLVSQSLQHFTESQSRDFAAPISLSPTTVQGSFSQPIALVPEPIM